MEEIPAHWGPKGQGGYLTYQKEIVNAQKEKLGEKFDRKEAMKAAGAKWHTMTMQEKYEKFGVNPPKPPKEKTPGNFLVFVSHYKEQMKKAGREEKEKGEFMAEAKEKWAAMPNAEKAKFEPPELTPEQKAEREAKKAAAKERKAAKEAKLAGKEEASPAKLKKGKAGMTTPQKKKKKSVDYDSPSPVKKKSAKSKKLSLLDIFVTSI